VVAWFLGVGLLFEIWIVDASIFVVCCVHCHVWSIVGGWESVEGFACASLWGVWVGSFLCFWLLGGGLGWWCV
jgi:hypothetical protein